MKKKILIATLMLCVLSFTGCGDSSTSTSNNETTANITKEKDFSGDSYTDTGDGTFLVVTSSGNSENGNVPIVYCDSDTSLLQIGYNTSGMNGNLLSHIYVDGYLLEKEQLADSQRELSLSGDSLSVGIHKVEVVQFENNDTNGAVITYKTAAYEIKSE